MFGAQNTIFNCKVKILQLKLFSDHFPELILICVSMSLWKQICVGENSKTDFYYESYESHVVCFRSFLVLLIRFLFFKINFL